jgi:uncharacterized membrane protein
MSEESLPGPQGARHALRAIAPSAPLNWLRLGWADFAAAPLASGFYGAMFAFMGWALAALFDYAYQYVSTLATAFLLAGPFLATGLYALSRDRERGRRADFAASLVAWRGNLGGLSIYVLVITVIALVWARASLVTFALFFNGPLPDLRNFASQLFTFGNLDFLAVWFAVGFAFAALVFCASAVSVPMMLDRGTDAISAALLSFQVVLGNVPAMLAWGALVALLTAAGLATAFLGLVVTMPLVGHATWHAYREAVAWEDGPSA